MTAVPLVVCPDCDGMTFTLEPCRCPTYGDRFLADDDVFGPRREAYRNCDQCRGAGQAVTVRFTRAGCAVYRHDADGVRLLAEVPDLRDRWCL
ncbi:hypothetical protein ACLQ24_17110 [Micromonospora sp. DT4]|uniref:hypothetical protein n=1 Tax=Micromonospora sp. DT4 TaxID=3393438 RepID=UPI003CEF2826